MVKAYNYAGSVESPVLGVVYASLPDKPPVPTKLTADSTKIRIDISDFPDEASNGCPIVTFDV